MSTCPKIHGAEVGRRGRHRTFEESSSCLEPKTGTEHAGFHTISPMKILHVSNKKLDGTNSVLSKLGRSKQCHLPLRCSTHSIAQPRVKRNSGTDFAPLLQSHHAGDSDFSGPQSAIKFNKRVYPKVVPKSNALNYDFPHESCKSF